MRPSTWMSTSMTSPRPPPISLPDHSRVTVSASCWVVNGSGAVVLVHAHEEAGSPCVSFHPHTAGRAQGMMFWR